MEKHEHYDAHVNDLREAYDMLIQRLRWECESFVECAKRVSEDSGDATAIRMLKAQSDNIRERAVQ